METDGPQAEVELTCKDSGEGAPAVVLLHGLFGASANLGAVARFLRDPANGGYRTLSCDLRNHGRAAHVETMDYALMADDVLAVLDRYEIARCALLGHSMGGKVAMQLALAHPQRVAALVVADIAPVTYAVDRHRTVFDALRAVPLAQLRERRDADALLAAHLAEPGVRQFLLSSLYRDADAFRWRFNLASLHANREQLALAPPQSGTYDGPVLFIKGADSDYIVAEYGAAIRERFPSARMHVIQGAGHWLHADKPRAFNAAVSRFLARFYPC